jgi:hypothetical protein
MIEQHGLRIIGPCQCPGGLGYGNYLFNRSPATPLTRDTRELRDHQTAVWLH